MKNAVYVIRCENYFSAEQKLSELLSIMGGVQKFFKQKEKVILKPNLLMASPPERGVTTHPAIIKSFGKILSDRDVIVSLIDSPGAGFAHTAKTLQRLYRKTGIEDISRVAGIKLELDASYQTIFFKDGQLVKHFEILSPLLNADAIVNLSKLKTHGFMSITGAVKNCFGAIPGRFKPGYHAKLSETQRFAGMLLDLAGFLSPRLSIMDAVMGMEGNGPSAGQLRHIGYLLAAENPLALDVVMSEMIGLGRKNNPVLKEAENRGEVPCDMTHIELIGEKIENMRIKDFKLPDTIASGTGFSQLPSFIRNPINSLLKQGASLKPKINSSGCVACGVCRDACPMHVITIKDYAIINYDNCIRCYCCHEMCPEETISLEKSILFKLLNR